MKPLEEVVTTCVVFNLPLETTIETVFNLFSPYGHIVNVTPGRKVTTSFYNRFDVDFSTLNEARAALAALDRFGFQDNILSVTILVK